MNAARSFGLAAAAAAATTTAAQANFVDIVVVPVDPVAEGWTSNGYDAGALDTYRIYAQFDDDTVDLYAIGDVANDARQFIVTTSDGEFVNDPLGGDFAPNAFFIPTFPEIAWDTYLTIGEVVGSGPGGIAITGPAPTFTTQAGGLAGDFILDDTGFFIVGFPPIGNPINGLVIIAQFTVNEGVSIQATDWRLTYLDTFGEITDVFVDFEAAPPLGPPSFLGLTAELVDPDAEGWTADGYDASALDTYRIYAEYDGDGVDVLAVADLPGDGIVLETTSTDGTFINDPLGGNVAPNASFVPFFPSLAWDTFVTIGEPVGQGSGGVTNTFTFPGFTEQAAGLTGDFTLDDTGWAVAGFPAHARVVNGRLLIAQFTVNEGVGITGTNWRIAGNAPGGGFVEDFGDFVVEAASLPCPADFDGNGSVGHADLTRLLQHWGPCTLCVEDINGSGDDYVGFDDLVDLLNSWGACP